VYDVLQHVDGERGDQDAAPEWLAASAEPAIAGGSEPATLGQLPCGRHGLPRDYVEAHQRARLLKAVVEVASRRGFAAATSARVAQAAGVSTTTFYVYFANRAECFLAACDASLDWLLEGLEQATATDPDWVSATGRGLRDLLERLSAAPELARAWLVELYAVESVDVGGARHRAEALRRLGVALRPPQGRGQVDIVRDQVTAGGIWYALFDTVARGRVAALPELLPTLHYHVLVARLDPEQAARIVASPG